MPIEPDWRSRLLSVITDPNVAYVLMLIGIYGLFFEFANPGYVLPGVAGAISLVLALYAFQILPVNYAGLALLALGIMFMLAEVFVPSFGALGFGGVIAFVIGSIILFDEGGTGYAVSLPLILSLSVISAGFFLFVVGAAVKARNRPVVSGQEEMLHSTGKGGWKDMGPPLFRDRLFKGRPDTTRNRAWLAENTGKVQVPYLIDPNTGVAIYESARILEYLDRTYAVPMN